MSNISITNPNTGITPVDPDIEFIQGNDGINVGPNPATHIILLLGDNTQGVDTSGNAVTYTETITMFDATTAQKGVTLLADDPETIAGTVNTKAVTPESLKAKLGVQTANGLAYGTGTTTAIAWLGEATNGQIPIGRTGNPPVLANITSTDGSVVVTNGPGTINLSTITNSGTGQTIGAVTANIITIPLGGVAGTFQFEARAKAFETTGPSGAGYNIYATFTTDGMAATLVGNQDIFNEDVALAAADAYFVASGNNAVLQVLGVALLTLDWVATAAKT